MKLNEQQINTLEALLERHNPDDSLNKNEVHGVLSALNVGPIDLTLIEKVNFILWGEAISDQVKGEQNEICDLVAMLDKEISAQLLSSEELELPCDLDLENNNNSFQDWLTGFFDAFFIDEKLWYQENEDDIAQMLLPFFACYLELEDEELQKIRKDKKVLQRIADDIPYALQDLYLFFHNRS